MAERSVARRRPAARAASRVLGAVVAVMVVAPVAAVAAVPAPAASSDVYEYLNGVAVASAGRAWAVGAYWPSSSVSDSLIERWNGTSWRLATGAGLGRSVSSSDLADVAFASRSAAWAVGTVTFGGVVTQTLIERWHGGAWRRVRSPNPGGTPGVSTLGGVAALSPSDAWAVGYYTHVSLVHGASDRTLTEHWNGRGWRRVPSPYPGGQSGSYLLGVAAVAASDAWAVGSYVDAGGIDQCLIEHWNGTAWRLAASPDPGGPGRSCMLYRVAAVSRSSAWAVGAYVSGHAISALIVHWNGRAWQRVRSPSPSPSAAFLYAVAASSPSDAWAVGTYDRDGVDQTLVERWNGITWRRVPSPNPAGLARRSFLSAVAIGSPSDVWATGFYDPSAGPERTLIEHWNGTYWAHVTSPNRLARRTLAVGAR